jgi:hypothetical protein
VRVSLFRQERPIGLGFAHGFLTPRHIAQTGMAPEAFWRDAEARCAGSAPAQLVGVCDWALLQFSRESTGNSAAGVPIAIGFGGPPTG